MTTTEQETSPCWLCRSVQTTNVFCGECTPQTCYNCSSSHVYIEERAVRCSHGCEYSIGEYTSHHLYTAILNASPVETLTYAGERVEIIIPNGTPITVHRDLPDEPTVSDDHILTTHCTQNADEIFRDGIKYPPHDVATNRADRYTGTVRDNALWAWPYTPDYVTDNLSWDTSEEVFLEVPENKVRVSSYRFIDMVSKDGQDLTIPVEKYDEALTFTVDQFRTAVRKHNQPCTPSDLLI